MLVWLLSTPFPALLLRSTWDKCLFEIAHHILLHAMILIFSFSSLLCLNMDRLIRIKFIEGCLANISKNESVAISLRLLPKLFQSFQNFRGMDTHEVSMFAERRHNMMRLFFDNLKTYTENNKSGVQCPFFNHLAQIQVRLQFLSVIFSVQVSKEMVNLLPKLS